MAERRKELRGVLAVGDHAGVDSEGNRAGRGEGGGGGKAGQVRVTRHPGAPRRGGGAP
jgi:hypothetical protein